MRLEQACAAAKVAAHVVRDGEFDDLGLLSHRGRQYCVTLYDVGFLPQFLANPDITCVITLPALADAVPSSVGLAVATDPNMVFYQVHSYLMKHTEFYWRSFDTEIDPSASVHARAFVARSNVRIGPGCFIQPGAIILERTLIGKDVVIGPGAVISGEGFEPKYLGGKHTVIPHAGGVQLHDDVEIQANTHIARAVFGSMTEVGEDTKIDALVQVSHNVTIGKRCEVAGGTFIGGSTTIGDEVWIGPNATISSEIAIGDGAFVTLGAVVTRDVAPGQRVSGNFAIDHERFLSFIKSIR